MYVRMYMNCLFHKLQAQNKNELNQDYSYSINHLVRTVY